MDNDARTRRETDLEFCSVRVGLHQDSRPTQGLPTGLVHQQKTRGFTWPSQALDAAINAESRPYSDPLSMLRIAPFIEQMGDWSTADYTSRKEFW